MPAIVAIVLISGCSESNEQGTESSFNDELLSDSGYQERTLFHQIELDLSVPLQYGTIHVYRLLDGDVSHLQSSRFDSRVPSIYARYETPASSANSALLMHVLAERADSVSVEEFFCFAPIDHSTTRHRFKMDCGYSSTIAYYLAATAIGRSSEPPFHDASARLPLWQAMVESPDNDVFGFYVSIFSTLQKALSDMGRRRFDIRRNSIRPVMETIVAQLMDLFQRNGQVSSSDLINIANSVTDNSLPLERLIRYQSIYDKYAYVHEVELENTGGSLTKRGQDIELLSMANELSRFYLRHSPFEMSDYRTHIVQNVQHANTDDALKVRWDPIPHMYGYNVYLNNEHIGYTRAPAANLPAGSRGSVTVKAVGYAGEFDGVHHDLSDPTLLAGVDSDAAN